VVAVLPSLHSPLFAPDREPTLRTGTAAMTLAALELFGESDGE
jgi:hippurate hydrolase